jgi:hypothetical protein
MMPSIVSTLLAFLITRFWSRRAMQLEIVALRHRLAVYKHTVQRLRLRPVDRLLWAWLARLWSGWQATRVIVQPRTVIAWQRKGFCTHWRRVSARGQPGRPPMAKEVRTLIQEMGRCGVGTARTCTARTMRVSPSLSPNDACGRVGRQRVASMGTFPTAPLRTNP